MWTVQAGGDIELSVVYRDGFGEARADKTIKWAIEADAEVARLSALSGYTDQGGVAVVTLKTFGVEGSATVTATVSGDDEAGAAVFTVTLEKPPEPVLLASAQYNGTLGLADFQLRLFKQDSNAMPNCGVVHPDAGGVKPTPDVILGPYGFGQQASIYDFENLVAEGQQSWVVQFVGPAEGIENAVGCNDGVVVKPDETAQTLVYVLDLPRKFRGNYQTLSEADLVTGLDGTAASIVGGLVDIFTAPGELIITWACQNASGTLGTLCNALVTNGGDLTVVGGIAADAADAALLAALAGVLGNDAAEGGTIVAEMLENLRFVSTMTMPSEPSVFQTGFEGAYFPANSVVETWTHVRFRWKYDPNCKNVANPQECGWDEIPLQQIYGVQPTERIAAGIDAGFNLHIDNHEVVDMTYGPLINALVETRILQLLFGDGSNGLPPVDSYDDAISVLLGDEQCLFYDDCCDFFTDRIADSVPVLVLPFIPAACEAAIPAAANLLRNRLLNLNGSISVASQGGCPSRDGDGDRWANGFGDANTPCRWDMAVPLSGSTFRPDATWRSEKAQ